MLYQINFYKKTNKEKKLTRKIITTEKISISHKKSKHYNNKKFKQ